MIQPAIRKQILEDLERLTPEMQQRALEIIRSLAAAASRPQGTPARDLLRYSGILDEEGARSLERTIEEGCERIDSDAW